MQPVQSSAHQARFDGRVHVLELRLVHRDLHIDPTSSQGPPDPDAVRFLRERFGLDDGFIAQMSAVHYGVPSLNTWSRGGVQVRIARFLSLYGLRTELPDPPMPDGQGGDIRNIASMSYMVDGEHQAAHALFGLCPFGMLQDSHPMALLQSQTDLVCLDFRNGLDTPRVVLWRAVAALDALFAWDELPFEQAFGPDDLSKPLGIASEFLNVPWSDFVTPLTDSWPEFFDGLEPAPAV